MLKWSDGARPGKAPKRRRTSEDVLQTKQKYEENESQLFYYFEE